MRVLGSAGFSRRAWRTPGGGGGGGLPTGPRDDAWAFHADAPLATGLSWANLGGGHGTATYDDATAGNHDGALGGFSGDGNGPADKWVFDDTIGRWTLGFDILPNTVQVPETAAVDLTGSLSFGCWFKSNTSSFYQCLVSKAFDGGSRQYGLYLSGAGAGILYIALSGVTGVTSAGDNFTISTPWTTNAWQHAMVTYSALAGLMTVYLNGASVLSFPAVGSVTHQACNLSVGCELGERYPLHGSLADPVIYSRAVSAAEVAALADSANTCLAYSGTALLS